MNGTMIVLLLVMIVALIGMIICNKKQETLAAAKPIAFALMAVVIGCGVTLVVKMTGSGSMDALRENESKFYASQGYVVGKFVKSDLGGGKVLLLADDDYQNDTRMADFVAAVKNGLGSESVEVVTLGLPKLPENGVGEPLSERMTAQDFEKLLKAQSDAKVLVSLVGLPRDPSKMKKIFENAMKKKGPALILLGYSEMPGMANAINAGAIAGVVTVSPKAVFDENDAPSDPEKAFAVRYILVTQKNIKENANLFGR